MHIKIISTIGTEDMYKVDSFLLLFSTNVNTNEDSWFSATRLSEKYVVMEEIGQN